MEVILEFSMFTRPSGTFPHGFWLIFSINCRSFLSYRSYFQDQWEKYLKLRGILDGTSAPTFPKPFDVKQRDQFYTSVSYSGWGGSSGHDAPMIAYDAVLAAGGSWKELAHRAFFHGGDSDSTAAIAGCWWGVLYGFKGVSPSNYEKLEYRNRLEETARALYSLGSKEDTVSAL